MRHCICNSWAALPSAGLRARLWVTFEKMDSRYVITAWTSATEHAFNQHKNTDERQRQANNQPTNAIMLKKNTTNGDHICQFQRVPS